MKYIFSMLITQRDIFVNYSSHRDSFNIFKLDCYTDMIRCLEKASFFYKEYLSVGQNQVPGFPYLSLLRYASDCYHSWYFIISPLERAAPHLGQDGIIHIFTLSYLSVLKRQCL